MKNPIQAIIDFNVKAGFIKSDVSEPNDYNESAYLIEEALEPYGVNYLAHILGIDKSNEKFAKNPQREVAKAIMVHVETNGKPTKLELVDKYLDAIVYAVGSLGKLGLSHQDITAGLNIVTEANMKKTANPVYDESGKLMKPDNWQEIEQIQETKLINLISKVGK